MRISSAFFVALLLLPVQARAQQGGDKDPAPGKQKGAPVAGQQSQQKKKDESMQGMPGMEDDQTQGMLMGNSGLVAKLPETLVQEIVQHASSGTSAEPNSTPAPMLMAMKGAWSLMFHANLFLLDEQQSSPRGGDKFFSTNWFMGMAQHPLGPGVFTARAMLTLEPATISGRQYPLLFQQGETAFGRPIADGQHPHNFVMEIAALYDIRLGDRGLVSFYAAPVGDPAMGPAAYPHRSSASENPLAALGHHQQDSTHIADDVLTMGLTYRFARIEASGFHGREPGENRWNVSQGKIDSWSARFTFQPGRNWSGQYSYGRITSPEAIFPVENQERMTASVMYNRPFQDGNWANSLIWGRARSVPDPSIFNSYTLESTLRFRAHNYAWTRIENVDRSNELILGELPLPPNFEERPIGRVQAYTFGYDRDLKLISRASFAVGGQVTAYGVGNVLRAVYGSHPAGVAVFLRIRPVPADAR